MDEQKQPKIGDLVPEPKYCGNRLLTLEDKKRISKKRERIRAHRRICPRCNWLRRQREFGRIGRSKLRKSICIYCEQTQREQSRLARSVARSRQKPDRALKDPKSFAPILVKQADIPKPVVKVKPQRSLNPMADAKDKRRRTMYAIFKRCLRNPTSYAPILIKR